MDWITRVKFSKILKKARAKHSIYQYKLDELCGWYKGYTQHLENRRYSPKKEDLKKIEEALNEKGLFDSIRE